MLVAIPKDDAHLIGRPERREHALGAIPRDLIGGAHEFQESGTTFVLFSPRDIQLGLGDSARGSMFVISPANMLNERWFKFDKKIDFAHCGPVEESGQWPVASGQKKPPSLATGN